MTEDLGVDTSWRRLRALQWIPAWHSATNPHRASQRNHPCFFAVQGVPFVVAALLMKRVVRSAGTSGAPATGLVFGRSGDFRLAGLARRDGAGPVHDIGLARPLGVPAHRSHAVELAVGVGVSGVGR